MCHFEQISDELKSQKPTRGLPTYQAGEHTCILKEEIPFLSCKRVKLSATWRPNGETFNFDRQIFGQKTAFLQHSLLTEPSAPTARPPAGGSLRSPTPPAARRIEKKNVEEKI